jgi:hypothetical protein
MLDKLSFLILILLPILFLNLKHSTNAILIMLFILSIRYLLILKFRKDHKFVYFNKNNLTILIIFSGPLSAVIFSQILRQDISTASWDSPSRMFMCIPIFLALSQGWPKNNRSLSIINIWIFYSFPIGLLFSFLSTTFYPSNNWGVYKTTYFVDPLTFCSYTLLFSMLISFGLINYFNKISKLNIILLIISILIGLHLSITSGARTGWLNIIFYLSLNFNKFYFGFE